MKKILLLALILLLVSAAFIGCGTDDDADEGDNGEVVDGEDEQDEDEQDEDEQDEDEQDEEEPDEEEGTEGTIALVGLGHDISIARSKGATDEETAQAQADVTAAAVGFDEDGTIVSVYIDVAQTRVAFDEDMQVTSDLDEMPPTKKELGDDYGMASVSPIGMEWYEQIEQFEMWMIGKNVEDVLAMDLEDGAPTDEELMTTVTIGVDGYLAAIEQAWNEAEEADGAETVGLGIETHIGKSKGATDEDPAQAQVDTYLAATAFDADETVVNTIIDVAQVRIPYDEDGQVAADLEEEVRTKKERGDDYGMAGVSEIGKEWYEQVEAFEEWLAGQTVEEANSLELNEDDAPAIEDLESSVTIDVTGYLSVLEDSAENIALSAE